MSAKPKAASFRAVVDRVEDGRWAVFSIVGGGQIILPVKHFPGRLREGQAFEVVWRENASAERSLKANVRRLQQALLKRSKKSK